MAARVGDVNKHGQTLLAKTEERGNHHFARLWRLRCSEPGCGLEYEANSCDFHIRRCPNHGQPRTQLTHYEI
jgi:hypothetical protein